jgi:short-subunit dehydrogenase
MQAFLEASRIDLLQYGVGVTTINPGFVETAMTEKNRFKMPFLMKVDAAARIMADGLERGRRVVEFPWPMSVVMRFSRLLPAALWERVTAPFAWRKVEPEMTKR